MSKYNPKLIERWNRCSMPNLAAEIFFHCGGHPIACADHVNITMELLEAFLEGEEDLTASKFLGMARLTGSRPDYLASKTLTVYRLDEQKAAQRAKRIFKDCRQRLRACDPECISVKYGFLHLERIEKMEDVVIRADINALERYVYMAELDMKCKKQQCQRRGIKKITAPGGGK